MCSFYGTKNRGTAAQRLARIEKFTSGVRCKAYSVETCNRKSSKYIWNNDINAESPYMTNIFVFYWTSFGCFKYTKF